MLDEKALRRPDFTGGREVVLADGQPWTFPLPLVRFLVDDSEEGVEKVLAIVGDGGAYTRLMREARETNTMKAIAAVARCLLTRNYDLTTGQIKELMPLVQDPDADPEFGRITSEVWEVAQGVGPKPSAGGGDL